MKFSLKLGYGIGQLSDGVKQAAFGTFVFFYYNQVLGLPASMAGLAALIAMVVDAVTDPMVGQISDRMVSKYGRRHPFMLIGAIPFGVAMAALFAPPAGLSDAGLFFWMLGWAITVRLSLTLFYVPHLSLGAEMVSDYHERTSLIGYRVFFSYLGALITSAVGFSVFFSPTDLHPNGLMNADAYPWFGTFCAIVGTGSMLITVFATRSVIPDLPAPTTTRLGNALFAFIDIFKTLRHDSYRILFFVILAFMTIAGTSVTLLIYVATYVFEFKPVHLVALVMSGAIGISFASPLAQKLAMKFDKKRALMICLILGAFIVYLPATFYLTGHLQVWSLDTRLIFTGLTYGISHGFFIAFMIVFDSMLSDVIDENEMHTGRREEGFFFAARAFATKASFGLGAFVAGVALEVIDFPKNASPDTVPVETIVGLAFLGGPLLMLLYMSIAIIISRYSLSLERHGEIKAQIAHNIAESAD